RLPGPGRGAGRDRRPAGRRGLRVRPAAHHRRHAGPAGRTGLSACRATRGAVCKDFRMEWYWYVLILLVLLVGGLAGLVAPRLRGRPGPPPVPPAEAPTIPQAPPAPTLETPEPTAGRLVRLRTRLSRSQSLLGRGLLAVLSRD